MPFSKGPWTVNNTDLRYKSEWVEVSEDQIIRPGFYEGTFTVVRMKRGVSVLAIDADDSVYLTREYRYAVEQDSVEVVSGAIDGDETEEEAGRRELKEELGIVANEWIAMGLVHPMTSQLNAPAHLFVARDLRFEDPQPDASEMIETMKMPMAEAMNLVMESKITHAPSCVLILKANKWLKQ